MACRRKGSVWLGACACLLTAALTPAFAQTAHDEAPADAAAVFAPSRLDVDELPAPAQTRVRAVVEHPTLAAHGPMEVFTCDPTMYHWLIDHPDQTVKLWRRLGAKCLEIQDAGGGRYSWKEGVSEVHWEVVLDSPHRRVWYAEGQVKPGLLLPAFPVKAVMVLDYAEGKDGTGQPAVRHQMQLTLHTDSRAVVLATRVMGDTAPKTAEKFLEQLQMFYAAMAWYLDQHPDKAEKMFTSLQQPDPPGTKLNSPLPPQAGGDARPPGR